MDFFIADLHFGHKNIVNFKDDVGNPLRPFDTVQDMEEAMIQYHNEIVKPTDKVYMLGDIAFNTRGLRNRVKRRSIFRHIRITYKNAIVVLQETHSRPEMEQIWRSEWAGQIFFAHGSETGQAGVAILIPGGFEHTVQELFICQPEGRLVCARIMYRNSKDSDNGNPCSCH